MKNILSALALFVCLTSSAFAGEAGMAGEWKGKYFYPEDKSPPVEFTLNLVAKEDGKFTGTSREPKTFGKKKATHLTATIDGQLSSDRKFTFTKQMDGSGGVTHAIEYSGEVAEDGNSAEGTWSIKGSWSGKFEMKR
jgi:hypothetical protein